MEEGMNTTREGSRVRTTKGVERCRESEEGGHGCHYSRAEGGKGKGKGNHSCKSHKGKSRPRGKGQVHREKLGPRENGGDNPRLR